MKSSPKKVNAAQAKLRAAQETIKKAKEAEAAAWREKRQAQAADPVYRAKQAERAAQSEARERVRQINKENRALAKMQQVEALCDEGRYHDLEYTAYHEAGHAVLHEVLSNGIREATIIPAIKENTTDLSESDVASLGHVNPIGSLPIPPRQQVLLNVVSLLAGGYAAEFAGDDDWELGTGGDYELIHESAKSIGCGPGTKGYFLLMQEAIDLCYSLLGDPKIWSAVEDTAQLLLTEKTISGDDVRALVKKQHYPDLIGIEVSRQLNFHYRKNRPPWGGERPLFALGIGINTGTSGYYYHGYDYRTPEYVWEFEKNATKSVPNTWPQPTFQMSFVFPPAKALRKRSARKV